MTHGPSKHLSWNELRCKDGTEYPQEWRANRAIQLAQLFEYIRQKCGNKPIIVVSAFRTPEWNKRIGGAPDSQHMYGRALDVRPPEGFTPDSLYVLLKDLSRHTALKGLGLYRTFVHFDIRPSLKLAQWSGKAMKDDNS